MKVTQRVRETISQFLVLGPKQTSMLGKLKFLVTCHVLLGDTSSGKIFVQQF